MFDDLLQRQMLVNKYIATLQEETIQRTEETDKALYKLISDFEMDATKKDKVALAKGGAGSKMAASLLSGIKKTLSEQTEAVAEHVDSQTLELARKEARATVRLMRPGMSANTQPADKPPSIGVNVSLGVHPRDAVKAMMAKHQNNVIQATASAVNEGTSAVKAIRGTPSLQGKDGVNHKRNNDLNGVVDQVATNTVKKAREEVYIDYKMERVDWVATLDLRACLICARYEMGSPYLISKVPDIPHPRCRCITIGHNGSLSSERPYVNDNRSVKYIPKNERAGKIGQTTNNFGQWFDGLNEDYKKQWLGKGRYELYKAGKINLGDMVKGNPARIVKLTDL